jgi:glycosyltransferase involved in cell wall biosynthesis
MRLPRVLVVSEIPTPYRLPQFALLAASDAIDLRVVFLARAEAGRPWELDEQLAAVPHRILKGRQRQLRLSGDTFVYHVNPGIIGALREERPDVVVVAGYAVFAEQAAIAWCRLTGTPYVLHSESHLGKSRASWVSQLKRRVLPQIVGRSAAGLAAGTAARAYLTHYGLPPDRIRIFPNTIDVERWRARAVDIRAQRDSVLEARGLPGRFHLYAGRLTEGKGVLELAAARRAIGTEAPPLVVAGDGPLARVLGDAPGTIMLGFQNESELAELFALADVTIVPSRAETWGVTVNESLASGTPVVASEAVGAVDDLVDEGVNGRVFPALDSAALAAVLRQSLPRFEPGTGPIAAWTYAFGAEQFLEAVEIALRSSNRANDG